MKSQRNLILASNIKAERARKSLTQFQLAELIGVSESTISLLREVYKRPLFLLYMILQKF